MFARARNHNESVDQFFHRYPSVLDEFEKTIPNKNDLTAKYLNDTKADHSSKREESEKNLLERASSSKER